MSEERQIETLNMISITVDKFISEIQADIEEGNYDPVVGVGKSGVGKTESIYDMTLNMGIGFKELRLVNLTETDMLGIPVVNEYDVPDYEKDPDGSKGITKKIKRTSYASNDLLPDAARDGDVGVLVLDEFTSANNTIRAAAYQLLDSKRALGNYKLPPKWKVVALGNGPDDGGVFNSLEGAFLSRATCYRIDTNIDCWKKWALSHDVNKSVIAFLSWQPNYLHNLNPDDIAKVFACPRSWAALSKRLTSREKRSKNGLVEREAAELYAASTVGNDLAGKFATFYEYNRQSEVVNAEDILKGKFSSLRDCKREVAYLTISSVVSSVKKLEPTYRPDVEADEVTLPNGKKKVVTDPFIDALVNTVKWAEFLGDPSSKYFSGKDLATAVLKDLYKSSKGFVDFVSMDTRSDILLPNFLDLLDSYDFSQ